MSFALDPRLDRFASKDEGLHVKQTALDGVLIITPNRFGDARGFFSESWNRRSFKDIGVDLDFVQDNHSVSPKAGTLRGLHFQVPPSAQAKLVRCSRGRLLDIAVDLRTNSPSFRQWVGVELSFENGKQLLIPVGFAHGFLTLEPNTEINYKCSQHYAPEAERSIAFDDSELKINWGVERSNVLVSEKDAKAPKLNQIDNPF